MQIPGCICRFALGFCKNIKKRTETLYQSFSPFMVEQPQPTANTSHDMRQHPQSVFNFVDQNIIYRNLPVASIQNQCQSIVKQIDCPQEDVDDASPVMLVIDIAPLERI